MSPERLLQQDQVLRLEQRKRLQILSESCERLYLPRSLPSYHRKVIGRLIVDDKFKILFSFIPKVSCTTWKKLFNELQQWHSPHGSGYRLLHTYSKEGIEFRLQNYRKAVFVRDPATRLLSAYLSKFRTPKDKNGTMMRQWEQLYGKPIVQEYRPEGEASADENGWLNITLLEFVRYVTEIAGTKLSAKSDHFIPMYLLATPCAIQYDFIGHFENLRTEASYMLRFLGAQDIVAFPDIRTSTARTSLIEEYKQVPLTLFRQIYYYYRIDYELFGYSFGDIEQTIYFNDNNEHG